MHKHLGPAQFAIACALALVVACDDSDVQRGDAGEADAGGAEAGSSGEGGVDTERCPASPPAQGSGCTVPTTGGFGVMAHCSWGDDPRARCRTSALCETDGSWSVTDPSADCQVDPRPASCGATPPTVGASCEDAALDCWFDGGAHCWCSPCMGGSAYPVCQQIDPPQWTCSTPAAGCPDTVPQAGAACTEEGLNCGPSCELPVVCEGGFWTWQFGQCPICASPDTPIATPTGERSMAELRAGDIVYSVHAGAIVAVPLLRVASTAVSDHRVLRVSLQDGATLEISPGHPTADGRTFGELQVGDELDGQRIVGAVLVPYLHHRTYDILPASDSGAYFAGGALIGSTLLP